MKNHNPLHIPLEEFEQMDLLTKQNYTMLSEYIFQSESNGLRTQYFRAAAFFIRMVYDEKGRMVELEAFPKYA